MWGSFETLRARFGNSRLVSIEATVETGSRIVETGSTGGGMGRIFYEVETAARVLGISMEEMEEMVVTHELRMTRVGTTRRLVRVSDVEAVLERVRSGGSLRTRREFRAPSVDGALDLAAAALGISPSLLPHEVLERGNAWSPGRPARDARVAVELPGPDGAGKPPIEDEAVEARAVAVREGGNAAPKACRRYYSPEQVAILLGARPQEINLRIYREDLPSSTINGYRWVPAEAVDRALAEISPPELESPPQPFEILTPPDPGPGLGELVREAAEPHPLEWRVSELEVCIEALERELRLEKARRAQGLESRPDLPSRGLAKGSNHSTGSNPPPKATP